MESNQKKDRNMAAIRAVVAELVYAILPDNYCGDVWLHKLLELQRKALIALSKPARQCDVGTPEEQERRFEKFCDSHKWVSDDGTNACSSECPLYKTVDCALYWAQMPYKAERKGEVEARGAGALKGNAGSAQ